MVGAKVGKAVVNSALPTPVPIGTEIVVEEAMTPAAELLRNPMLAVGYTLSVLLRAMGDGV